MSRSRQGGAVLVVCLILLLIITAIAGSTLSSGTFQTSIATNAQKRETVFRVAESSVEQVLTRLPEVSNSARQAPRVSQTVSGVSTTQAGIATPVAKVTYAGDEDGMRQLFVPGIAVGGPIKVVARNYEVEGSAKTSDARVASKVVLGVVRVEPKLEP